VSSYINFSRFMRYNSRPCAILLCRSNFQTIGIDSQRSGKTFPAAVALEIYRSIVATGSSREAATYANSRERLVPLAWLAADFAFASVRVFFRYLYQHPFVLLGSWLFYLEAKD
jgi:hypothetical protein